MIDPASSVQAALPQAGASLSGAPGLPAAQPASSPELHGPGAGPSPATSAGGEADSGSFAVRFKERLAASDQAAAAEVGPAEVGPTESPGWSDPFSDLQAKRSRFQSHMEQQEVTGVRIAREHGVTSSEYLSHLADQQRDLVTMQMDVQQLAFQAELASKVVENGTGSARRILETQA